MPPVRDTLCMVKDNRKGKEPVDTAANASASENVPKVKEAWIEIPRKENPSIYDICIHTQQTLERHIKMDGKEKVELMAELNLIHKHTRQIPLHEKDARKRSWTLLRKHYSRKDLAKKGLFKEYDHLDLLEVPGIRRQTPVIPQHSASTDLLFVNHDDEIADIASTRIYKPDVHPSKSSKAKAATPASASTTPHSSDSDSSSGLNFDSEDSPTK
jgi:hypothetical protein